MPGLKSKFAFQWTVDSMNADVFFWTFTFAEVLDLKEAVKRWHRFLSDHDGLRKSFPGVQGVRVYELHPGKPPDYFSHGLHVHAVLNQFLPVDQVRAIAERKGFGRIHVKKVPRESAKYLAKYLGKKRPECFAGMRLWAPFGKLDSTKVRDIEVSSRWGDTYRLLAQLINGFKTRSWPDRIKITNIFYWFPERIEALKIGKPYDLSKQQEEAEFWGRIMEDADEGTL